MKKKNSIRKQKKKQFSRFLVLPETTKNAQHGSAAALASGRSCSDQSTTTEISESGDSCHRYTRTFVADSPIISVAAVLTEVFDLIVTADVATDRLQHGSGYDWNGPDAVPALLAFRGLPDVDPPSASEPGDLTDQQQQPVRGPAGSPLFDRQHPQAQLRAEA